MPPYSWDLLEQQKQQKQNGQDPNAPITSAPSMTGGGLSFGGSAQPAQPKQQGTSKQGSGFVSLDKYMGANQGNNFGGQFTGKVQGQVDQGKQTLNQGAQGFTQASNQGSFTDNSGAKSVIDTAGDGLSDEDKSKVKSAANATYQGPETFLGSSWGQQAQGQVQKAAQQGQALQSEGGRFALLDQFYGRPQYSAGQKGLDNLLVQNDKKTAARSQAIGNQAQSLSSQAADQSQVLDNVAQTNKAKTQATAKDTQDYLKNAKTGFQTDLQKRYGDYQSQLDAYNNARRTDLSDDTLDHDTLGMTGLNNGDSLYGVNLADYVQDSPKASLGQFASDKDYARYMALQQLSGEDPTLLTADGRKSAGTAGTMGRVGFDQGRLQGDIAANRANFQNAMAAPNSPLNSLSNIFGPEWAASASQKDPAQLMSEVKSRMRSDDSTEAKNYNAGLQGVVDWIQNTMNQYGANRQVNGGGGRFDFSGMAR